MLLRALAEAERIRNVTISWWPLALHLTVCWCGCACAHKGLSAFQKIYDGFKAADQPRASVYIQQAMQSRRQH